MSLASNNRNLDIYTSVKNNQDLVDISIIDSSIIIDLKYATKDNFLNHIVYNDSVARLRMPVALALKNAQSEFLKLGYSLKVLDAYRPMDAQKAMWQAMPDERYVSNPKKGGRHTRGTAVDVTLVDFKNGQEVEMPTEFDNFTEQAHRKFNNIKNSNIKSNVLLLENIMHKYGFIGLPTEWWHFDYSNWEIYNII